MNKVKDIAKKAGATLTVAALAVANTGVRVFAQGNAGDGGSAGGAGTAGQNAQEGLTSVNPGANDDLNAMLSTLFSMVFGIIGVVAVIMIIIGGVNYTVSQGDSQKLQKSKSTILYGIIGLVIVLLAFAIVNFVLNGINGK